MSETSTTSSTPKAPMQKPPVPKLLYNKKEAAYALGISVRSLENLLYSKQLAFRKCGRLVLIPAGDVHRVSRREQLQEA